MKKTIIAAFVLILAAGGWFFFTKSGQKVATIIRTGGQGPGNCDSEEACRAYCMKQAHAQECFEWQRDHGYIYEEDIKRVNELQEELRASLVTASPQVRACLEDRLGVDTVTRLEDGTLETRVGMHIDFADCFALNKK